jgi:hypothetical protein
LKQLRIATSTNKIDPLYDVTIKYTTSPTQSGQEPQWQEIKLKAEFRKWFSADGYFVARPFQHFLASSIPIVGEADPKNAAEYIEPSVPQKTSSQPGAKLENFDVNIDNMSEILATLNQQGQGAKSRKRG